jgi:hypothetical protein
MVFDFARPYYYVQNKLLGADEFFQASAADLVRARAYTAVDLFGSWIRQQL